MDLISNEQISAMQAIQRHNAALAKRQLEKNIDRVITLGRPLKSLRTIYLHTVSRIALKRVMQFREQSS